MSLDFAIHTNNIFSFLFLFFFKRKRREKKGDINKKLVTDKKQHKTQQRNGIGAPSCWYVCVYECVTVWSLSKSRQMNDEKEKGAAFYKLKEKEEEEDKIEAKGN